MMKNILVLMSTYNGAQYLDEQLSSIIAQKNVKPHLLIRDDGSTDDTLRIIKDYQRIYPNQVDLIEGSNIGWKKSFFTLSEYASKHYTTYDYFSYADQDDIWLPDKLSRAIERLSSLPPGLQLYCSNLYYYRDSINLGKVHPKPVKPTFKNCLIRNYAAGCTIVINDLLLNTMVKQSPNPGIAYDYWLYLIATLCGHLIADSDSFILYRQHRNNQIGIKRKFSEIWKRRLTSFSSLISDRAKENLAIELLNLYGHTMSPEARKAVEKLAYYRNSFSQRLALLLDNGYTFNKPDSDFWLKLRIILGRL